MLTELRFPVVEVLLPRRIRFLRVFGDDDGDNFGVGFGEDPMRCFCPLCLAWLTTAVAVRCFCLLSFRSGGWKGSVPISSDGAPWLAESDVLVCYGSEGGRCSSTRFLRVRGAVPGRMLLLRPFNNAWVFGASWWYRLEGGDEEDDHNPGDGEEEQ
ncbi:hypothetical protein PVAP13_3KG122729 [Panicum virgatum]|uniref:Uncharacterized protein n=1 Tax=Panicum virgatum TaxID=38727 RepID=A0A8T0V2T0_PANVG|nr:hypothetical protein PVAP13_3KG122729 [Panicum virgatum]